MCALQIHGAIQFVTAYVEMCLWEITVTGSQRAVSDQTKVTVTAADAIAISANTALSCNNGSGFFVLFNC